ncbi:hypothetical protein Taro_035874 [Colocasia esculenta]|uniref:Uncharacterized protein n=1 Tax=Colocasia esculenta TaxID=4460 RepID=A0A843WBR3_COLES|nr:hypothetical protein [Colocasia esculenta]
MKQFFILNTLLQTVKEFSHSQMLSQTKEKTLSLILEARALLGRMEYNRGNVEAALHVFNGIDIAAIVPKIKLSLSRRAECQKLRPRSNLVPPMSMHAVSLLFEAIFLKAKSLVHLGRYKDAAQSCNTILEAVESAFPGGLPENFGTDCKFQETLSKAVELLPELWKLAGFFQEAISSYRRALLTHWNLGAETTAKIQKEFAIFLLYGGCDANPPNLRSQMDGSFVPRNNIEEAVLLLMILLRMFVLKKVEWDPSIINHLTFALSIAGELNALAKHVEALLPGVVERKERYYALALCYLAEGDDFVALNLLKKILTAREDPNCLKALLLAARICGENSLHADEGVSYARRALANLDHGCDATVSVANLLLSISLSTQARSSVSDTERVARQSEALEVLEKARKTMKNNDHRIIYTLSLENADQRKLDVALHYAKMLVRLEAGSDVRSWILLARILSAEKRFVDAETIINVALDQTGKWSQGELLRIKARVQVSQGQLNNAIVTYSQLLSILQLRSKSLDSAVNLLKGGENDRTLELAMWHDLAMIYTRMHQWRDAEVCISKLKVIRPFSASSWHATGQLYEAKGLHRQALGAYRHALEIEPTHVPSLVSTAMVLRQLGHLSVGIKSFLTEALRLDRTNYSAWFNLGLLYKSESGRLVEAAECFEAATLLEESAPMLAFESFMDAYTIGEDIMAWDDGDASQFPLFMCSRLFIWIIVILGAILATRIVLVGATWVGQPRVAQVVEHCPVDSRLQLAKVKGSADLRPPLIKVESLADSKLSLVKVEVDRDSLADLELGMPNVKGSADRRLPITEVESLDDLDIMLVRWRLAEMVRST